MVLLIYHRSLARQPFYYVPATEDVMPAKGFISFNVLYISTVRGLCHFLVIEFRQIRAMFMNNDKLLLLFSCSSLKKWLWHIYSVYSTTEIHVTWLDIVSPYKVTGMHNTACLVDPWSFWQYCRLYAKRFKEARDNCSILITSL